MKRLYFVSRYWRNWFANPERRFGTATMNPFASACCGAWRRERPYARYFYRNERRLWKL